VARVFSVDINQAVELARSSLLGSFVIIGKTGSSIIERIDKQKGTGTSSTSRSEVTGEPFPIAVLFLAETKHTLELIFEGEVEGLGGEVSKNVGQVSSPKGNKSFLADHSRETIADSLVGFSQTTRLDHFILVLDQELHAFNRCSCGLGDSGRNSTHQKIDGEGGEVALFLNRHPLI